MTDHERLLGELPLVAFAIAYRMLGSVSEAEDVVPEALLRVHQALDAGEQLASPRAFAATVTTRRAIDELRSARARRERHVGQWLPGPIVTGGYDDPARNAETADSLSLAMLVLLESISPEQRAALVLHDVFDYGYPEIAAIVGKSADNARQLATRARCHGPSASPDNWVLPRVPGRRRNRSVEPGHHDRSDQSAPHRPHWCPSPGDQSAEQTPQIRSM